MLNLAIGEQYPPGSTYKLVTGSGALQDRKITATTRIKTEPFIKIGRWKYWDWNKEGFGPVNIYGGFGHSSDTYFFQPRGHARHRPARRTGRTSGDSGSPPASTCPGRSPASCPRTTGSAARLNEMYYTGEVYQAGIGQGYNASSPIQVLNAYAALANGGTLYKPQLVRRILDSDGNVVQRVQPEVIRKLDIDRSVLRDDAGRGAPRRHHPPHLQPRGPAHRRRRQVRHGRVRHPRQPGPSAVQQLVRGASCPRRPARRPPTRRAWQAVRREDSDLVVLAYAHDTRTAGNAATEIVKYFLQLHYGLGVDLRQRWVLERANFYGG